MRSAFVAAALLVVQASVVQAQGGEGSSSVTPEQRRAVSDERAAEIKRQVSHAKQRQERFERQNTDLWSRWTNAVCIGCEPPRRRQRIVYTNPLRVLAGIPAAEDDDRAMKRVARVKVDLRSRVASVRAARRVAQRWPSSRSRAAWASATDGTSGRFGRLTITTVSPSWRAASILA